MNFSETVQNCRLNPFNSYHWRNVYLKLFHVRLHQKRWQLSLKGRLILWTHGGVEKKLINIQSIGNYYNDSLCYSIKKVCLLNRQWTNNSRNLKCSKLEILFRLFSSWNYRVKHKIYNPQNWLLSFYLSNIRFGCVKKNVSLRRFF